MRKKSLCSLAILMTVVALMGLAVSCSEDDAADSDTTPPMVVSTVPEDVTAQTHLRTAPISVTFSEKMDRDSITANTTYDRSAEACNGTIQVKNEYGDCYRFTANPATTDNKTFTLQVDNQFDAGPNLKIIVTTDAKDSAGNALEAEYIQTNAFKAVNP